MKYILIVIAIVAIFYYYNHQETIQSVSLGAHSTPPVIYSNDVLPRNQPVIVEVKTNNDLILPDDVSYNRNDGRKHLTTSQADGYNP